MNWLARCALDRPGATLLVTGLLTLVFAAGMLRLELRTDGAALHPQGDPVIEQNALDEARFRDPRLGLLLVVARPPNSLATPEGFRFLRELHEQLRRQSVLRSTGSLSLASLPRMERGGSGVFIGTHLDSIPDEPKAFARLLDEVRARPLTDGLLLAADGKRALFSLPLSEVVTVEEAVRGLSAFADLAETPAFEIVIGGPLVAETMLGEKVLRDLAVLVPVMLVAIVALLYTMLRTIGGVMIPMLETLIVLVWTFGAMGWLGAPIALVTTILPVVLMAMCITDEIHLLERVAALREEGGLRDRLEAAYAEVGRPIVLTSITTALGFLSFRSASIEPLREFGTFAAFGILAALVLSFSFIPALMVKLPEPMFAPPERATGARWLAHFGSFASRRPGACFAGAMVVLLAFLPGVFQLRVSDSWVENFAPEDDIVRAERGINESFWGSYRFDVVFEGAPEFFREPGGVSLLEAVRRLSEDAPHVGGVETYLTPLEEIAEALGAKGALSKLSLRKLWDLFTLAEMSDSRAGLAPLLADDASVARARFYVNNPDYAKAQELEQFLTTSIPAIAQLQPRGGQQDLQFHYSGDLPVASALVESIVHNQLRSIGWAIVTIAVVLFLAVRRVSALWALVPVLAASAGLLGFMGLASVELGIATSMFASLVVGVGVDFGIHFIHRFERERGAGRGAAAAVRATFDKAGRALFWNAMTLAVGFSVLIVSSLKPNHSLGLLLAAGTLACCAGSFTLLPFLLRTGASARGAALVALLAVASFAAPIRADSKRCEEREDSGATLLMARIESRLRATPRIVHMQIDTRYREGSRLKKAFGEDPVSKTLWSLTNGDPKETRMLFVITGPGRMMGTSLLIRDPADPKSKDRMWFYLAAFENFSELGQGAERIVVPGSALTYEDSRGFIAASKYRFRSLAGAPEEVRILACPRTPALADALGYSSIELTIDPKREVVQHARYQGLGGGELKRYVLLEALEIDGTHLPREVRLEHTVNGFDNLIHYQYWPQHEGIPAEQFSQDVRQETFLSRLRKFLHERSLGGLLETEIELANARIRAYEERMR